MRCRFLLERYTTFKKFALDTVMEIYTPAKIQSSQEFVATELSSGIFVNQGSSGFDFQPLPRIAQIAPGFGTTSL